MLGYGLGFLGAAGAAQGRGMLVLDAMFMLMALVLPLILIWLAAWLADELARQTEIVAALAEITVPLIGALDATREALDAHGPASPETIRKAVQAAVLGARGPDPAPQFDRLLAGQARLEAALQKLAPSRVAAAAEPAPAPAPSRRARRRRPRRRIRRCWPSRRRRPDRPGTIWCARSTSRATPTMPKVSARCGWRSGTTGWRRCCRRRRTC